MKIFFFSFFFHADSGSQVHENNWRAAPSVWSTAPLTRKVLYRKRERVYYTFAHLLPSPPIKSGALVAPRT